MKQKRRTHRSAAWVLLGLAGSVFVSCSVLPMDQETLSRAKDDSPPVVTVQSPEEGMSCANIVEVRGSLSDLSYQGAVGKVVSASWSIPGTAASGPIIPAAGGDFVFQVATDAIEGQFSLLLEAVDWNGNKASRTILLTRDSGDSLPSFTVSPGNGSLSLSWATVPNTDHYLLYYTADGSLPSDSHGTKLTIPQDATSHTIEGLANSNLYCVRLKAVPVAGWAESASDYLKAIPLSPMTLCPRVEGDVGLIRVSWNGLPAGGNYEVWRRSGETGEYSLYAETSSTELLDRNIENGQSYGYKIKPSLYSPILSHANSARPVAFLKRPTIAGSVTGLWEANDITISGNYAFVSDKRYDAPGPGLYIYDLSQPLSPRRLASLPIHARGTVVVGNYAYVITNMSSWNASESSLYVIDISLPSAPAVLGSVAIEDLFTDSATVPDLKTTAYDLAVSGSTVYVAAGLDGLQAFDVSTPSAPAYIGACATPGTVVNQDKGAAMGVALKDGFAFVSDHQNGIHTVRLSDLTIANTLPNVIDDGDWPQKLVIEGNALFAAEGDGGVKIFKITADGTGALVLGLFKRVDTAGLAKDLALQGGFLYVADGMSGLQVIDVYDIAAYLAASELPPAALAAKLAVPMPSAAQSVAVSGSYAYVVLDDSLQVVDLSLASRAKVTLSIPKTTQDASKVEISGTHAYVATNEGLWVADLSDPANPAMRFAMNGAYATWFEDIAVSGPYLFGLGQGYTAEGLGRGLLVCDLSDPASPRLVATHGNNLYNLAQVQVSGAYAYVACDSGLVVMDINDPLKPETMSTVPTGKTYGVAIRGNLAYVVCSGGLDIIDLSDPGKPIILSNLAIQSGTNSLNSISVLGRYAYACDMERGLVVVDVADPENPIEVKALMHLPLDPNEGACYMSFSGFGPWGILTSFKNKVRLVNIADPTKAFLTGTIQDTVGTPRVDVYEAAIYDSWAYMTDSQGLKVVQLTP